MGGNMLYSHYAIVDYTCAYEQKLYMHFEE